MFEKYGFFDKKSEKLYPNPIFKKILVQISKIYMFFHLSTKGILSMSFFSVIF